MVSFSMFVTTRTTALGKLQLYSNHSQGYYWAREVTGNIYAFGMTLPVLFTSLFLHGL
jgi:hypothetical protein